VVRDGDDERVTVTLDAIVTNPTSPTTVPAETISTG
jgi:hypothetical protein